MVTTHKSSAEVQLSSSSSLTCQNLETVTLTPPSEPLFATPTRPLSDHFSLNAPHVPLSSLSQMPPLSPNLSQPTESDEHITKLLEMVTVEEIGSIHTKTCSDVDNSSASNLCLLGHDVGVVGSGTTSGTYEQSETGTKSISNIIFSGTIRFATVLTNFTQCKTDMEEFVILI